jgi:hypothetical protein
MEARLRVLETHPGYIKEQLTRIETTTTSTKAELSELRIETARPGHFPVSVLMAIATSSTLLPREF